MFSYTGFFSFLLLELYKRISLLILSWMSQICPFFFPLLSTYYSYDQLFLICILGILYRCMLYNFAGNIEMYGVLDAVASEPVEARRSINLIMVSYSFFT